MFSAIYRCRLCGEIFTYSSTGEEIAIKCVAGIAWNQKINYVMAPTLLIPHYTCNDGSIGLADFQGMRKEKTP